MSFKFASRVKETTTTTGTGTYNLGGASASKYRTFAAGLADEVGGSSPWTLVPYAVFDGTDWEVGYGTVTSGSPDTLSRTVVASSNGGSAVNWAAGSRDVILTPLAQYIVDAWELQESGPVYAVDSGGADTLAVALTPVSNAVQAGMKILVKKSASANTGACTLNVDSHGADSIKDRFGNDPAAGELPANAIIPLQHDGTNWVIYADPFLSEHNSDGTHSDVTADSVSSAIVTLTAAAPGGPTAKSIYEDSIPKVWLNQDGTTTPGIVDDVNVASITDTGVGIRSPVFSTNMAASTQMMADGSAEVGSTREHVLMPVNAGFATTGYRYQIDEVASFSAQNPIDQSAYSWVIGNN